MSSQDLDILRRLFQRDYPEAFEVFNVNSLEKNYLIEQFKTQAFETIINQYLTGRTGAGKTSFNNCFLVKKMPSTGKQDCTSFVAFFNLKGNLRSFDTPGVISNYDYDNINRAALCLPQKSPASRADKKAKPEELLFGKKPGIPYKKSDSFLTKDYTSCIDDPNGEPIEKDYQVGEWEATQKFKPDVIFYLVAPHQLFLDGDRKYYDTLLDTWGNIVIPVLNIHCDKPDGTIKPSPENIQDARQGITEIYRLVFETDQNPPIFEMNCLTGEGIAQLTEYVCQILPPEKVGNFGNVIKDDLKQYAQKQRKENYYHNLAIISGLLSRLKVKDFQGRSSLLHTTASALMFYGMRTFKSAEAIEVDASTINQEADKIKNEKEKDKYKEEDIINQRTITEEVPIYGEKTETRQEVVPKMKIRKGWFGREVPYMDNEVVTLTNTTSSAVIGTTTKVIDQIKEVVGKEKIHIGKEHQKGGYEAAIFLLSVGLAIEAFCEPKNELSFNSCLEEAKIIAERKVQPYQSQIEQLVNDDTREGEKPLINLLDKALLN